MILGAELTSLEDGPQLSSDLHISALGYETRCLALHRHSKVVARRNLFLRFAASEVFSYSTNHDIARSVETPVFVDYPSQSFIADLSSHLLDDSLETVSIDISSMNRTMIASVLSILARAQPKSRIQVVYIPAKYETPSLDFSEIVAAGPVLPEFAGFEDESDLPGSILMGLGFEYGVALGLINLIEPQNAICMYAEGHDDRFEGSVKKANLEFRFPGTNASAVGYNLFDPIRTYEFVSSTVRNLHPNFRLSLIPMGPKVLSCLFTLVSIENLGKVTLWRVVRNASPLDSHDDGKRLTFSVDGERLSGQRSTYNKIFL